MLKTPSSHDRVVPALMARMLSKVVRRVEPKGRKIRRNSHGITRNLLQYFSPGIDVSGTTWQCPAAGGSGLPPLKWSDLKYGFDHGGEGEWLGNGIVLKR
jgi:hypothetical protein